MRHLFESDELCALKRHVCQCYVGPKTQACQRQTQPYFMHTQYSEALGSAGAQAPCWEWPGHRLALHRLLQPTPTELNC